MNRKRLPRRWLLFIALSAGAALPVRAEESTDELLRRIGVTRGICVVLGDPALELAMALARRSELLVYVQLLDRDIGKVGAARAAAEAAGLDATRLQIDGGSLGHLHLADNIADALIARGGVAVIPEKEALRVLRPGGKAILGVRERVKPFPDGIDDWSHPYHGPDNNTLSRDRIIRFPYLTRFLADPQYGPAPQAAVASGGRVFKAFGHVAWHEREEPYLDTLVAFNGFNGTILWKRKLPEGLMVHRNTLIATPDVVYLGDDESCKIIDAATGKLRGEIRPPVEAAGGTFWKWMALEGGVLYAMIGEQEQKDPPARWRRTAHGWPWNQISKGYNQPEQPWGFGRNILAIDPESKEVLWHYEEKEPADGRAVCMRNGRIFAFRFGAYLTCLDAKTGKVIWRRTKENAPGLFEALGECLPRQGWSTNWRTVVYLKASDRALYFAGPQVRILLAVSADDGRILWQHPYDNFQLVLRDDGLYAISGPWGQNVSKRFDSMTGKVLEELPTGRRACTRPTGTSDSIIYRAMGGSVRLDLESSRPRWISPMRPPCQDGVTVASGHLYWWPYACDCQLTLVGLVCLGAAGGFDFTPAGISPERLEVFDGSGAGPGAAALPESAADWPTFRANNQATCTSGATIPDTSRVIWQTRPSVLSGTRPTAPVAAGGLVFLAGSDGVVRALDASTGRERWKAYTGGEVRIPPTIWKGRALVGSGDGWVYAYDTASGQLFWRFRTAPAERRIPVYGRLLSTWPAASGVRVEEGIAYVASGIVNYDGTYVYAIDAATGKVKWVNDTSGHLDPRARTGVSVQGHLLLHDGKLYLAGGNAVSPAAYDVRDGKCLNDTGPLSRCESTSPRGWELFLVGDRVIACGRPLYVHPEIPVYDHTVTRKLLHASTGECDIAWVDGTRLLCFKLLDKAALSRCVTDERVPRHITQAWGEFKVPQKALWIRRCPGSVAVALARNAVLVADPSRIVAMGLEDGRELWTHPLPAAPVPWGLAVDRDGRAIVTLTDGQVLAIGG